MSKKAISYYLNNDEFIAVDFLSKIGKELTVDEYFQYLKPKYGLVDSEMLYNLRGSSNKVTEENIYIVAILEDYTSWYGAREILNKMDKGEYLKFLEKYYLDDDDFIEVIKTKKSLFRYYFPEDFLIKHNLSVHYTNVEVQDLGSNYTDDSKLYNLATKIDLLGDWYNTSQKLTEEQLDSLESKYTIDWGKVMLYNGRVSESYLYKKLSTNTYVVDEPTVLAVKRSPEFLLKVSAFAPKLVSRVIYADYGNTCFEEGMGDYDKQKLADVIGNTVRYSTNKESIVKKYINLAKKV